MNKNLLITLSIVSLFTISGCTSERLKKAFVPDFNYFTDTIPTVKSLNETSHNIQIYRKTAFFQHDFKSNGELKNIYDYDFANEDAPCTVLGDVYYEYPIFKEAYYTVNVEKNKSFVFHCRPTNDVAHTNHFRLFLIGTYHECNSRRWDYNVSLIPSYQKLGQLCSNGFKTKANLKIENDYNKALKNKVL